MKENILQILNDFKQPLDENKLLNELGLHSATDLSELCNELRNMELNSEIYRTNNGKYILYKYTHLKSGRLSVKRKGFGFVLLEGEPDIYVSEANMNGAIHSDLVVVEKLEKGEGKVIKIIDRSFDCIIGEFVLENGNGSLNIDNDRINMEITIDEKDRNNAMPGHKILVKPYKRKKDNVYLGEVVKILGHKDDPGIDILSVVYEHNINDVFPKKVLDEVEKIPLDVNENEIIGRRDLRSEQIFTIDGDSAKDFDDAVCIKKLENGNYKLGVHIADVSHYVKKGTELNKEALERATSVYLVDRVIPMLPHKLSNGICSLNPNVDRLTLTCDMEIDSKGKIVNHDLYESVINSKKRMTYREVNKIFVGEMVEGYEEFEETLAMMYKLSKLLRGNKMSRGYLDFAIDEIEIKVDESGKPIDVSVRERGISENIIEDFMIAANETVAEHFYWLNYPAIYRIHEKPKAEKLKIYLELLNVLGHKIKGNVNNVTPKFMQNILNSLKGSVDFEILSEAGLRSMQKAEYHVENKGHFGLASKFYTHFTSPIRRYPDLCIHSILKDFISGKTLDESQKKDLEKKLIYIATHSSEKERSAIECERDVVDMKTAEYMEENKGKQYIGKVSGVIPSGMFVRLENLIEGFVHISSLEGDYYVLDEKAQTLKGRNDKKGYRVGDSVTVKVISSSKEERKIDFELVKIKYRGR